MAKQLVSLKVAEANQDDVDKGIVRIDTQLMKRIGASPGSIVEIEGEKVTVAIADRAFPADLGLNIIRMDSLTRRNGGTSIGETVKVSIAEAKPAKKIVVAPAQKGVLLQAHPSMVQNAILGRALTKGDFITMGGTRKRRRTYSGNPMEVDIFGAMDDLFTELSRSPFAGLRLLVISSNPKGSVVVTEDTEIEVRPESSELEDEQVPDIAYEDIGGLEEEIKKVREMIELPLKHPVVFDRLGIQPPKGVLLYGPPGTGKTLLAKAVANESKAHFMSINGPEIMSKFVGEAEKKLRGLFEEAEKNAPSIVFIDEVDAIAPKREESYGEVERRVVAQLLALMDGLQGRGKVIVIAATNRPDALDPALRRGGRFDREIEIGVPNKRGRLDILKIHTRNMSKYDLITALKNVSAKPQEKRAAKVILDYTSPETSKPYSISHIKETAKKLSKEELSIVKKVEPIKIKETIKKAVEDPNVIDISELADTTHGFVGADLEALCKEAAMNVIRNVISKEGLEKNEEISEEVLQKLIVTKQDFKEGLKMVRPSAMREVLVEAPKVYWEQIGGLDKAKQELKEAVEWPLKNPNAFSRMGIRPPKGILIYGPPGTGKTLLAKAVATESSANFISVKGPEVLSKWVGESERAIREIFKKARQVAPSIIFFDEIDSIASSRGAGGDRSKVTESVLNQILTEMDGLEELADVVVIAATNRPELVDPAILRPGRFDRHVLAMAPNEKGSYEILKVHTRKVPIQGVDLKKLATKLNGYSGADIESVVREAAMLALRNNIKADIVTEDDFKAALEVVKPSLTINETAKYEQAIKLAKAQLVAPSYMG